MNNNICIKQPGHENLAVCFSKLKIRKEKFYRKPQYTEGGLVLDPIRPPFARMVIWESKEGLMAEI